jgi:hypothetical protein
MIAITKQPRQTFTAQQNERFLEMLPLIRRQARQAFRRLLPELKDELLQEVIANAYCRFSRLVRTGKADLAFATPLADFAIRQVLAGRRVGTKLNTRDIMSHHRRAAYGVIIERLNSFDHEQGEWREALVEDHHTSPADIAAARIDVADWFRAMPRRTRRIAKTLAMGESAGDAAKRFRVSQARISQLRRELWASWEKFQGEGLEKDRVGLAVTKEEASRSHI